MALLEEPDDAFPRGFSGSAWRLTNASGELFESGDPPRTGVPFEREAGVGRDDTNCGRILARFAAREVRPNLCPFRRF